MTTCLYPKPAKFEHMYQKTVVQEKSAHIHRGNYNFPNVINYEVFSE